MSIGFQKAEKIGWRFPSGRFVQFGLRRNIVFQDNGLVLGQLCSFLRDLDSRDIDRYVVTVAGRSKQFAVSDHRDRQHAYREAKKYAIEAAQGPARKSRWA